MSQQQQQQQHTQEPVAEVYATSYIANDGDVHTRIEIRRLQNVKVGTLLYAFTPDAAARIAELEAENWRDHAAFHRLADRFSKRLAELEKQRDTLLKLVECISQQTPEKPDYWSSCSQCEHNISDAEDAIASVKEQA